ncbi:Protein tyrosine/serine phosphatase [Aminobacter sp. MSH1]|uniref:tyrosine-protein phosphatase n=1 Tax=Aminobacter sp. MSH1 TaxID=374606 RepID=UPI000D3CF416|nr:tyrosine-protein phosphatase [Aminobacter sp. MSH1]AWC25212.1 Protein tyrosine/serine phosphatase [Aminobacter sp. MSH1]
MKAIIRARSRAGKAARTIGGVVLVLALSVGGYFGALQLTGNFHPVVANELYRSAQPTAADIASYQKMYGVKTIVNLRGENTGSPWYDAEIAEAKQLGITHVDFRMSARRELTQAEAGDLIGILEQAEKPVLIHCKAGADRSGLAAALYVAAVAKLGEAAAEAQISIRYGHISLPLSSAYAMDRTFEALEPWLGFQARE